MQNGHLDHYSVPPVVSCLCSPLLEGRITGIILGSVPRALLIVHQVVVLDRRGRGRRLPSTAARFARQLLLVAGRLGASKQTSQQFRNTEFLP